MPQTRDEFVARYGGVYEHSPWVAEQAYDSAGDVSGVTQLAKAMSDCVDHAPAERKLALIRAHPDLAGKAAIAGELTDESSGEQAAAGIDRCSAQEYAQFQSLNERYKKKFGFPFVMAVRNSNRQEILETFARRLENDEETEFATAIAEIHKIARMRLKAMAQS